MNRIFRHTAENVTLIRFDMFLLTFFLNRHDLLQKRSNVRYDDGARDDLQYNFSLDTGKTTLAYIMLYKTTVDLLHQV